MAYANESLQWRILPWCRRKNRSMKRVRLESEKIASRIKFINKEGELKLTSDWWPATRLGRRLTLITLPEPPSSSLMSVMPVPIAEPLHATKTSLHHQYLLPVMQATPLPLLHEAADQARIAGDDNAESLPEIRAGLRRSSLRYSLWPTKIAMVEVKHTKRS